MVDELHEQMRAYREELVEAGQKYERRLATLDAMPLNGDGYRLVMRIRVVQMVLFDAVEQIDALLAKETGS